MRISLAVLALASLAATGAQAQTRTTQFAVRAFVLEDCEISAQNLNFGFYTNDRAISASTPLTLQCTPGAGATISLDAGFSGNPRQRHMTGRGELEYQLYRDAAHQDPIDTLTPAFHLHGSENTGEDVIFRVYGEVPANQLVPGGVYFDIIRVTVNY